jgi:hypothetical protein
VRGEPFDGESVATSRTSVRGEAVDGCGERACGVGFRSHPVALVPRVEGSGVPVGLANPEGFPTVLHCRRQTASPVGQTGEPVGRFDYFSIL